MLPTVIGGIHLYSYLRELITVLTSVVERLHGSGSGAVTISCKDLDPSRGERFKQLQRCREIRRWRTNNGPHKDKYTCRHSDHNNDCNVVSYKIRFSY